MTIALTGATGFVGQAVLDLAAERGQALRALARRPQAPRPRVDWIAGDLASAAALGELFQECQAVIHVAGLTSSRDPAAFAAANVAGTAAVITAAREARVARLVFVSSLAAREPGLSAYGASKAEAEALVEGSGLDWTIVRPPGVYGPRDIDYFEMFRAARRGIVPVPARGASSIIHVADLARLLLDLVEAPPTLVRRRLFEPDDGRDGGWSHRELAQAVGRAVGRARVLALPLPALALRLGAVADGALRGDKARLTADRASYMAHPNWVARSACRVPPAVWEPAVPGEQGLAQTAGWYRDQGWFRSGPPG